LTVGIRKLDFVNRVSVRVVRDRTTLFYFFLIGPGLKETFNPANEFIRGELVSVGAYILP